MEEKENKLIFLICGKCCCVDKFSIVLTEDGVVAICDSCEDFCIEFPCHLKIHKLLDKKQKEYESSEKEHQDSSFDWVFNN